MSSLRARMLLLVAVVLIPSFALLVTFANRERQLRLETAQASAMQLVDVGVRDQQEAITDGLRILRAFSMIAGVRSGSGEACSAVLATLAEMLEEGWSVSRTRANGMQDCATRSATSLPRDVSDNPVFQRIRRDREPVVGAYVQSATSFELLLPINVPLLSERGVFEGVLSTGLRLRWFESLAAKVAETPDAVVNITAGGDRILRRFPAAAPDAPAPAAENPITRAMRTQGRGVIDAPGIDSVRRVWAFDRLPSADSVPVWLLVGLPASAVYASANTQLLAMLAALAVWLVVVIVVGWWATDRFVVQDVHRMLAATERIGRGDLSARTGGTARTDELARLAASVDHMAERLHD
jgi:HAMP domain-containing protein